MAAAAVFCPYLSDEDDESWDDGLDDLEEFEGRGCGEGDQLDLLAPVEDYVDRLDREVDMQEHDEDDDVMSSYHHYFEDPEWGYHAPDTPADRFDNLPLLVATRTVELLEKDLRGLPSGPPRQALLSILRLAQDTIAALPALEEARRSGHAPRAALETAIAQLIDYIPPSCALFGYLGWNVSLKRLPPTSPAPSLQPVIQYGEHLNLPALLQRHAMDDPPAPGDDKGQGAAPAAYKHDAFSSAPVLLKLGPLAKTVNRAALQAWLEEHGLVVDDVRVAYHNKESLGWAAVKVLDDAKRKEVYQALQGLRFGGTPLDVTVMEAVDGADRAFLMKAGKAKPGGPKPPSESLGGRKERERKEREAFLQDLTHHIRDTGLADLPLCFIDFELACSFVNGAIPSELSLLHGTLGAGELACYHCFVHPGLIPAELEYTAAFISLNITGIPFKNFRLYDADYGRIWQDVQSFVPPTALLVAKDKRAEEHGLRWLGERAEGPHSDPLRWLKAREGPAGRFGLLEWADLWEALAPLLDHVPTDVQEAPALREEHSAASAPPLDEASSASDTTDRPAPPVPPRASQPPDNLCPYHYEALGEAGAEEWHCSLGDVRALMAALQLAALPPRPAQLR